jgi:hypothetical protein
MTIDLLRAIRQSSQYRVLEPLRYALANTQAQLKSRGRQRQRVLLIDDQQVYTSEQQYAPLLRDRKLLRRDLGVVIHYQRIADILRRPAQRLSGFDVVGLKISYRTSTEEALKITRTIRDAMAPQARLVYFDGDDDLCVMWPGIVSIVDLYVKKHLFRDRAEYKQVRIGKTNLTNYVAQKFDIDFKNDDIPTSPALDDEHIQKLTLGWNIGLDDKIDDLHQRYRELPQLRHKDIDVVCRASVPNEAWISPLRAQVIPQINALRGTFKVLTPDRKVSQDIYNQEMLRSKICVSPFGNGEVCWRDFEAVLFGCVLVKPDMSHLETAPDVFIPNETYVPLRWDCQDLTAHLTCLLEHPEECERLRNAAAKRLRDFLNGDELSQAFGRILELAKKRRDLTAPT